MRLLIFGLSITSSWGNGHATTYRGLARELDRRGHRVLFLERNQPWYVRNRDTAGLTFCETALYDDLDDLRQRFRREVEQADGVIVGSYVPEGIEVGQWVTDVAEGVTAFYDIDTPVTLASLRRGECRYLSRELIGQYDLYLSFTGGPILEQLRSHYGARLPSPFYCSADPAKYYPEETLRKWQLGYLGTYSADRQPRLEELLLKPAGETGAGRFVVAGPQYPEGIAWPANVERIDHLGPRHHRAFYNAQRFTLNLTRDDMIEAGYSPSVRLFEAAACGIPIISDRWEGLGEFFEIGREILVADSCAEVFAILHELAEEERLAIGRRARARVLREHTAAHRATGLETLIHRVRSGSPEPRKIAL
ncbi:MAG TPA: glycosyltransferase [Chthoniobacteraceae bacterium]|nr:glycosyltransferase [Chthoniobacteraceae bacterium]